MKVILKEFKALNILKLAYSENFNSEKIKAILKELSTIKLIVEVRLKFIFLEVD